MEFPLMQKIRQQLRGAPLEDPGETLEAGLARVGLR